jgi:hypothetical protein
MAKENETIADIIAEMRGARTEFPFVYLMGEPDTPEVIDFKTKEIIEPRKINIRRVTVKELADRLEAAHKRERGDCAKLREAVKAVVDVGYPHNFQREAPHIRGYCYDITRAIEKCFAALAAPPRNCDVGTVGQQDERFTAICNRHFRAVGLCDKSCPCRGFNMIGGACPIVWGQLPYVEKEGCAK